MCNDNNMVHTAGNELRLCSVSVNYHSLPEYQSISNPCYALSLSLAVLALAVLAIVVRQFHLFVLLLPYNIMLLLYKISLLCVCVYV